MFCPVSSLKVRLLTARLWRPCLWVNYGPTTVRLPLNLYLWLYFKKGTLSRNEGQPLRRQPQSGWLRLAFSPKAAPINCEGVPYGENYISPSHRWRHWNRTCPWSHFFSNAFNLITFFFFSFLYNWQDYFTGWVANKGFIALLGNLPLHSGFYLHEIRRFCIKEKPDSTTFSDGSDLFITTAHKRPTSWAETKRAVIYSVVFFLLQTGGSKNRVSPLFIYTQSQRVSAATAKPRYTDNNR